MSDDPNSKSVMKIVVAVFFILVGVCVFQLIEFESPEPREGELIQKASIEEKEAPFQEFADTDLEKEIEEEVFDALAVLEEPDPSKRNGPPGDLEMEFATPVAGNPLVVVLPGANASLGQISIEKYDHEGNATGQPLKRGTQVQIPDPNNPGGRIFFKVP